MSPEDEYDIKESFHVMDEDKTGEISLETFYTLCLGLGYDVQRDQLEQKARSIRHHELHNNNRITIDMVLEILSKVRIYKCGIKTHIYPSLFCGGLTNRCLLFVFVRFFLCPSFLREIATMN